MIQNWNDYLKPEEILRLMCRWRARLAAKRHPAQNLAERLRKWDGVTDTAADESLRRSLPSRRQWIRPGFAARQRMGEVRSLEMSIFYSALRGLDDSLTQKPAWTQHWEELLQEVGELRNSEQIVFHPPALHLIPKKKGSTELRCLASFDHLADRLLISRAATYLRDRFDLLMDDGSYAFRKDASYSYKTAVDELVRYRRSHVGERLYVAECDIQSFFDVINHEVVLEAYDGFVQRLDETVRPEPQLRRVLEGYLNCFTSRGNLAACTDARIVSLRRWVKSLEQTKVDRFYEGRRLSELPLGVPQGGALSPLIANLVLSSADRAVRSFEDPDLLYLRYCDDIVIVHTSRKKCGEALDRYMKALEMLKLPMHRLVKRVTYGKQYFEAKSKGPFIWAEPNDELKSAIPWVAFLGVHIRHDGAVCVRPSSIVKHEDAMKMELRRYRDAIGPDGNNLKDDSPEGRLSLLKSFEARIVAMGTGYSTLRHPKTGCRCWSAAFPAVSADDPAAQQLRRLDSMRGHVVAAFKKALGFGPGPLPEGKHAYYGRPYSYYGLLTDAERHASYPTGISDYSKW